MSWRGINVRENELGLVRVGLGDRWTGIVRATPGDAECVTRGPIEPATSLHSRVQGGSCCGGTSGCVGFEPATSLHPGLSPVLSLVCWSGVSRPIGGLLAPLMAQPCGLLSPPIFEIHAGEYFPRPRRCTPASILLYRLFAGQGFRFPTVGTPSPPMALARFAVELLPPYV
jgi:hypothetical protein